MRNGQIGWIPGWEPQGSSRDPSVTRPAAAPGELNQQCCQKMRLQISEIANNHVETSKFWNGHSKIVTTGEKKSEYLWVGYLGRNKGGKEESGGPIVAIPFFQNQEGLVVSEGTGVEEHWDALT